MNRIMRNSGAALAAIFIAGSLTACGPGSASSSRSDTNPTEVSTDLGNKKYELTLWDGAGLKAVDEALIAGFEAKYPNITITGQYDPDNVSGQNGPRVISAKDAPDMVVPEFLRTLVFARPRGDDQFADCTFSPSLDMSR